MIRILFCFAYVIGFSFYAWKNWFVSLCALILLMAFFQHPDMPKSIGGVQGLNPWNVLMANVTLAWLSKRKQAGLTWDLPKTVLISLIAFSGVIVAAFLRLTSDPAHLEDYSFMSATSDYLINNIKWLLIAVIFFDTVRTERQVLIGLSCVIGLYFLLAIQVIKWVPLQYAVAGSGDFSRVAYKLIQNEIGYNRVTLSMILGAGSWATLAFLPLVHTKTKKLMLLGVAACLTLGQALTGGRTGYISWAAVGIVFCTLRWRKLLLLVPVVIMAVATFLPGVRDRMLAGLGMGQDLPAGAPADTGEMTSGRTIIWPHVLDYIGKAPMTGYGRLSMQRTGLTDWLFEYLGEDNFGHPHNAYLEQFFDNGIPAALCCVFPIFVIALIRSFKLFLDKQDLICSVAGGVAGAAVLALFIGSLAGQTFYPREGSAGMWAAIGVMLRVSVERARSHATGLPIFASAEEQTESDAVVPTGDASPA